jgi:hypothetical protein
MKLSAGAVVPMKSFTADLGEVKYAYRSPGKTAKYVFVFLGIDHGNGFDAEAALASLGWKQTTETSE